MKRFYTFFVSLILLSGLLNTAAAQDVLIPDAVLAGVVREALDLAPDAPITQQAMLDLTRLEYVGSDEKIVDLTGLEHATNLTALWLSYHQIRDLTPLENLTSLTELGLWSNQVSDLTPLENLTNLTKLSLAYNQVSDLTPLGNLANLMELWLGANQVSDLKPLESLTNLTALWLGGNRVSDLTPLGNLTNLTALWLGGNRVSDLKPLANLTNLTELWLHYNQVSDLTPLANLTSLTALWLQENQITDITPLVNLINLQRLALAGNPIQELTSIEKLLAQNPDLEVDLHPTPRITGPWLWMIAPTDAGPGVAHSTDVDSLADASGGTVTETAVATNGAAEGDAVGSLMWTLGEIAGVGEDNVNNLINRIGFAQGNVDNHSAYALITLESATVQSGVTMQVGSDDSIKVWLNGEVVHRNAIDRPAIGYQDSFVVDLVAGDNLLLVKVSERVGYWGMFVGIDADVTAVYKPPTRVELPSDVNLPMGLPEGAKARLGKGDLSGGTSGIAFSPNGNYLAVASGIGIWMYDMETTQASVLLTGHSRAISSVSFSPDSTLLASGDWDGIIKVWDVAKKQTIATFDEHALSFATFGAPAVSFSPDGTRLASAASNTINLWDIATKENIATLKGHADSVSCIAFSPDGTLLASGASDGIVKLWDVAKRQTIATLIADEWFVSSVTFSPDGKILVSGGPDEVKLWDVATHQNIFSFEAPTGGRQSVAFSPSGKTLAYISLSDVKLWDVATRTDIATLRGAGANLFSVAFSSDGTTLAAGSWDDTVKLWNTETREKITTLAGYTGWVTSVAFSPDGTTLAAGSYGDNLKLWDVATGQNTATLGRGLVGVSSVAYSADGKTLVTGEGHPVQVAEGVEDGTVNLWDIATRKNITELAEHTDWVYGVALSPDGHKIASGGGRFGDYTIRLWDAQAGVHLRNLIGHSDRVSSVAFSPDNTTLASGSWDNSARLWDVETGTERQSLKHTGSVHSVAFSPDGLTLASGSDDATVRLWDVETGTERQSLTGHTGSVNSVAFSPDGATLASGSSDNSVRLWDVETGAEKESFAGHTGSVNSVAFSPDGATLASGSDDGTILLWSLVSESDKSLRPAVDVNNDGIVNIQDLVLVAAKLGETGQTDADVNGDGVVNIIDILKIAVALGNAAAAPTLHPQDLAMFTATDVQQWLSEAQSLNLTDITSQKGILFLRQLLAALIPKETVLLPNYPNPFNPETWIPYQLAQSADVTLTIYDVNGRIVRTLALGHQPAGIYTNRGRAAYWDGRNAVGEFVASGVYFYTLTAGEFNATRKLLIRK